MQALYALLLDHAAAAVFLATFAARVGAPVPAAPLLMVTGAMAASGGVSPWALVASSVAANVLGDGVWFAAGRRLGYRVLGVLCRWSMSPDSCVRQSESLMVRWGGSALIAAKFVPGVSLVAAPMAGALHMSVRRFLLFGALGGLVWTLAFAGLGALLRSEIDQALAVMARTSTAAGLLLVLGLFGFAGWRWWRRRRFLRGADIPRISAEALQAAIDAGEAPLIVDVRSSAATRLDARHIPGALPVELRKVVDAAAGWPPEREIVTYCNCPNDASAVAAAQALIAAGHLHVRPLAGGLQAWMDAQRTVALAWPA